MMRHWLNPGWVLAASALLGAATCSNSRQSAPPDPAPAPAAVATPGKAAPTAPTGGAAVRTFAQVDLGELDDRQRELFIQVANDEFCPCDCPVTLAACLQADSKCPAAPLMAQMIVRDIKAGMPEDILREQLTEAFSGGYNAPPKNLVLDGYATLGPASAPITIVEYSDFECPHCRDTAPTLKALVKKYPGEVRLIYKHFPLSGHPAAKDAAVAVEAAGRQGKFWEMHDKVFENQEHLSQETLRTLARQLGLDMKRFEADLGDPSLLGRVEASRKEGEALGIQSTPTVYVNGRRFGLRRSMENFESRLAMERVRGQGSCR
ncbi:MAG: thioredoxin domain-containing protein [Myxococcota bacterium]